ncbi:MAG TPA: PilZ domain-containing protein [Acidobacteriaceae bacterium]
MRKFEYRHPRLRGSFIVEFIFAGRTLRGTCINISDAGIRATLDGEVPAGSTGLLTMRHPHRSLTIQAVATHLQADEVGLSFIFHSKTQRELTRQFLASATGRT